MSNYTMYSVHLLDRRRTELEDKAKVVGLGDRILSALAVLPQLNRLFQKDLGKTASMARGTVELNRLFQKD